ncbi:MAG: flagellar hook-basal body complex protein FliE [Magnetococcales bacterium]|nr:flagellar hook-basal body complex protein FliE [Magnetococcales bacterium]
MAVNNVGQAQMPMMKMPNITLDSGTAKAGAWEDFSKLITDQVKETNRLQKDAKDMSQRAMLGNAGVSLHEAQVASSKAEVHLKFLVQVRNKAVEVYKEIMNMPA